MAKTLKARSNRDPSERRMEKATTEENTEAAFGGQGAVAYTLLSAAKQPRRTKRRRDYDGKEKVSERSPSPRIGEG